MGLDEIDELLLDIDPLSEKFKTAQTVKLIKSSLFDLEEDLIAKLGYSIQRNQHASAEIIVGEIANFNESFKAQVELIGNKPNSAPPQLSHEEKTRFNQIMEAINP